jgi:hypothetical protein
MRIATRRPRKKKTKLLLSKTNGATDSRTEQGRKTKGHLNATIVSTPELEATKTGTGNSVFTLKYRTIPKKNVYVTSNGNSEQQDRDQQGQQPVFT